MLNDNGGLLGSPLNNYISETPELNLKIIEQLFLSDFSKVDVVIIKSQQGCGGTHLLRQIGNQLIDNDKSVFCVSAMKLCKAILNDRKKITGHLLKQSYILVDDLDFLFRSDDNARVDWLKSFLETYLKLGGKFIFSHTSQNLSKKNLSLFFGNYRTVELESNYPSYEMLESIALQYVPDNIVSEYSKEAYQVATSTRTFLNQLISINARKVLSHRL